MRPLDTALVAATAVGAWLLVGLVRHYALKRGVLDIPNARSSHSVPTPRGAGIAVLATVFLALALATPRDWWDWRTILGLLATIPSAFAGWIDDHRGLRPLPRLVANGFSGALLVPLALSIPSTQPALIAVACVAAAMVAATVVNFMDGLDGFIGVQALVFAAHIALLGIPGKLAATVGMVIAAAALGFLVWNWHPAKIFLGDVGSNALAILSLYAAILVFAEGRWEPWSILLPLFPLLFDALATLLLRAIRGERLSQAHRKHLYQRLANERWGHSRVAALYGLGAAMGSAVVSLSDDSTRPIAVSLYILSIVTLWCILHYRFRQSLEPERPVVSR